MNIKISFIAPSEYGKNTAVNLLKERYRLINIKLALPLYKLQEHFYKFIQRKLLGEQDGELLQFLGNKIRKENSDFLIEEFSKKLKKVQNFDGIITNDDCRPPDYQYLKENGFIFIKINGFKRNRIDHTKSDPNSRLEWHNQIPCDYEVDNFGTMEEYKENLYKLLKEILKKEDYNKNYDEQKYSI